MVGLEAFMAASSIDEYLTVNLLLLMGLRYFLNLTVLL